MTSPFSEPTALIKIFGSYQSQVKSSMQARGGVGNALPSSNNERLSEKRPIATRLAFDESFDSFQEQKIPRLNRDPFDSVTGRKRFASENTVTASRLTSENEDLKEKLKSERKAGAEYLAKATRLETRQQQMVLEHKKALLEAEQKLEKCTRLYKCSEETKNELTHKLQRLQEKRHDKDEKSADRRRQSLDKTNALEHKVHLLRESKMELEDKVEQLQSQLSKRVDIDPIAYRNKIQHYKSEVETLNFRARELEGKNQRLQAKLKHQEPVITASEVNKEECTRLRNRVEKLQCELEANREAVLQRRAMQDKLDRFAEIERENASLVSRNDLLVKTQTNVQLLHEEISTLRGERERAANKARDRDIVRADLEVARMELKSWLDLMAGVATQEQRRSLAEGGLSAAREILLGLQAKNVQLVNSNLELKAELNSAKSKVEEGTGKLSDNQAEYLKVKREQAEQSKLVKKLQRKLLLVSKERDSNKAILDSVEKEMTMSGNQWDQERIQGLEKTLDEYKAMVNMLMGQEETDGAGGDLDLPSSSSSGGQLALVRPKATAVEQDSKRQLEEQLKQLEKSNLQLQSKCESMELELERRAIKGDYNTADTKVLHFKNNPSSLASEKMTNEVAELKADNDSLRARVKLLEEGQTKDITLMVGRRLDEGASSAEVQELQDRLKSADTKNQRMMEIFKKTSQDFREFVALTTGYKIDKSGENKYKLHPLMADSGDYLLFMKSVEEGVQMLETEYSSELVELMELHLEQHNSIPMFLAGLTIDLFRKTKLEEEEEEQDDDGEGEEEEDVEEAEREGHAMDQDEGSQASVASDCVICVDDD